MNERRTNFCLGFVLIFCGMLLIASIFSGQLRQNNNEEVSSWQSSGKAELARMYERLGSLNRQNQPIVDSRSIAKPNSLAANSQITRESEPQVSHHVTNTPVQSSTIVRAEQATGLQATALQATAPQATNGIRPSSYQDPRAGQIHPLPGWQEPASAQRPVAHHRANNSPHVTGVETRRLRAAAERQYRSPTDSKWKRNRWYDERTSVAESRQSQPIPPAANQVLGMPAKSNHEGAPRMLPNTRSNPEPRRLANNKHKPASTDRGGEFGSYRQVELQRERQWASKAPERDFQIANADNARRASRLNWEAVNDGRYDTANTRLQTGGQTQTPANARTESVIPLMDQAVRPVSFESDVDPDLKFEPRAVGAPLRDSAIHQPALPLISSPEVEAKAMQRVGYGKSLARRGAFFAAKEEFLNAMYIVAESYDRRSRASHYSMRLKAALRALDEVKDFGRVNRSDDSRQLLQFVLAGHNSKLIAPDQAGSYTPEQLVDLYCKHATSHFEQALGKSPAASESLFAYGRLLISESDQESISAQVSWSVFWAAFATNPLNDENTNEIGVRLLNMGQLSKAKDMFLRAAQSSNSTVYWNNLAEAHRRMAQNAQSPHERNSQLIFANQALEQAKIATSGPATGTSGSQWVSVHQFHEDAAVPDSRLGSPQYNGPPQHNGSRSASPFGAVPNSADASNKPGLFKKLKKWF